MQLYLEICVDILRHCIPKIESKHTIQKLMTSEADDKSCLSLMPKMTITSLCCKPPNTMSWKCPPHKYLLIPLQKYSRVGHRNFFTIFFWTSGQWHLRGRGCWSHLKYDTEYQIVIACDWQYSYQRKFVKHSYASCKVFTLTHCDTYPAYPVMGDGGTRRD